MNVAYAFKLRKEIRKRANAILASGECDRRKQIELCSLYSVMHPLNKYLEKQGYTSEMMATIEEIIGK